MSADSVALKRCTKCGQEKPATSQHFRVRKYGLISQCRDCERASSRENSVKYHYEHYNDPDYRERRRKRAREYYQENKERILEYAHQRWPKYYGKPQVRHRILEQARTRAKRPQVREHIRQYQESPRGRAVQAAQRANRRARKSAASGKYTADDIQIQLRNQTDRKGIVRCWWCNKPLGDDQSIDHRIPLARGGSNDARNIVIVHLSCNQSKQDKLPHEWNGRLL